MYILKCFSLSLVLFMFSCSNVANQEKAKEEKQQKTPINVVTFDMATPAGNDAIGSRSMGKAKSGELLEDRFAVKNATEKPVVIVEAKTNCGCVTLDYTKEPIKVGEQRVIKYTYDSRGKIGQQLSQITIKTTAGEYRILIDLLIE